LILERKNRKKRKDYAKREVNPISVYYNSIEEGCAWCKHTVRQSPTMGIKRVNSMRVRGVS